MIKWVGPDNYVGNPTFYMLTFLAFIMIMLWPSDAILMGTTRHVGYAKMAVFEGIINVTLSIWWINIWGVAGVAAATIAARLITNGWYMFYRAHAITGIGANVVLVKAIKPLTFPALGAIVAVCALDLVPYSGWRRIFLNTTAICAVFMSIFYFSSMNRYKVSDIMKFIRGS
jgi:hypothetical protein